MAGKFFSKKFASNEKSPEKSIRNHINRMSGIKESTLNIKKVQSVISGDPGLAHSSVAAKARARLAALDDDDSDSDESEDEK